MSSCVVINDRNYFSLVRYEEISVDVSIIIPTFNNSSTLNRTLGHLCSLSVRTAISWELIVVNNNCTDTTDEVVKSYFGKLPIRLYHQLQQGTSVAKNSGLELSTGELVIFTDDDVRPIPEWLESYWDIYSKRSGRYFFGGPVVSDFESTIPDKKLMHYAPPSVAGMNLGEQLIEIGSDRYFIGANWACPRNALDEVGRFDTDMGLNHLNSNVKVGEETDLMDRLRMNGYRGLYLPMATVYHFVPAVKTTLNHVATRAEAHSYYVSMKEFADINLNRIPRWLYRMLFVSWLKLQIKRIIGRELIDAYIFHKVVKGKIRAASDCIHNNSINK